jgi:hypothetical protein
MTKTEFAQYCLRKLGQGMIVVNVTPDQIEDRIKDAYDLFVEKHYDASEGEWVLYKIGPNDVRNGYITLDDNIRIVDGLLPYNDVVKTLNNNGSPEIMQFSMQWRVVASTLNSYQALPFDSISYYLWNTGIGSMQDLIGVMPRFEYTYHKRKLVIYNGLKLTEGDVIAFHVKRMITMEEAFEDRWFKQFATANIKAQWGSNLKKHSGMEHLGGIQVNGQQIYDEAIQEMDQLKTELIEQYELPPMMVIG